MASWIPADILRVLLDLVPPVARGRTILASTELHSTFVDDFQFWDRIWDESAFYLQPRDRHHREGLETKPIRLDLCKSARAISALNRPNALEKVNIRKIMGIPAWVESPDDFTSFSVSADFCTKQAGFGATLKKTVSEGSYSDDYILDDLFFDVSRIRETANLHDLPVVSTQQIKKAQAEAHWRTKIQPCGDGSGFLLYQTRWSDQGASKLTLFHLDRSNPGRFQGDPAAPLVEAEHIANLPSEFKKLKANTEVEVISCLSSLGLIVQPFTYLEGGTNSRSPLVREFRSLSRCFR